MIDDRTELKALVLEVLTEVLTGAAPAVTPGANTWVSLKDAVKPLGYPSYKALYADVSVGLFRVGKEVRDRRKAGAQRPRYQINLARAQKRLSEDPANRRSV